MGSCCSTGERIEGSMVEERHNEKKTRLKKEDDRIDIPNSDCAGSNARVEGSSRFISMFTQQGRKGINQDAMTVLENFNGEKDMYLCAVFDGHGPSGHKVSQQVRDSLPLQLCTSFKKSQTNGFHYNNYPKDTEHSENVDHEDVHNNPFFGSWKSSLIKAFEEMDENLCSNVSIDTYFSGSTAVAVLKQGDHMVIANLGDSRAVLYSRGDDDQLVSVQLTIDLKPNLPKEAERIKNCEGRVFAMDEEPEVFRMWMPEQNCPGLAMARAFGDFCLKDFGLISIPEVSYRRLTDSDEFVVLATDGIWDVLSNDEVAEIVASARKRSIAARLLVDRAVKAWRHKYPNSRVDDCAVVCLFLKNQRPFLTKAMSAASRSSKSYSEVGVVPHFKTIESDDGLDTVINCEIGASPFWNTVTGLTRSLSHGLGRRRTTNDFKD
ncbi:hypothetical protein Vadar_007047 [Vaccinium darrowii]|uniref:Uncharacterized protein n=1 Tax=Vaccinium darrowii TaxID=229202 RepID=A0ACB7XNV4_9ERIC|nr:hypothetical protein Vadar_007047 [Vaccinium darrowii]